MSHLNGWKWGLWQFWLRAKADGVYQGGKRLLDREEIKAMMVSGLGPPAIANALGCSRMQVYRVFRESEA